MDLPFGYSFCIDTSALVDLKTLTVEVVGDARKVEALIELMRSFGIRELVRTGRVAILRH